MDSDKFCVSKFCVTDSGESAWHQRETNTIFCQTQAVLEHVKSLFPDDNDGWLAEAKLVVMSVDEMRSHVVSQYMAEHSDAAAL